MSLLWLCRCGCVAVAVVVASCVVTLRTGDEEEYVLRKKEAG